MIAHLPSIIQVRNTVLMPLWQHPPPSGTLKRHLMPKVDAEKAAKLGDMLYRYMRARHRFKDQLVDQPLPAHELAQLIARGKYEFDQVYIELHTNPPIAFD